MNFRIIPTTVKMVAVLTVLSLTSCKKDVTSANSNDNVATLTDSSTTADNAYYDVLNNAFVSFADNSSVWNISSLKSGQISTMSKEQVLGGTGTLGCAIYSFDNNVPGEYPKTLSLDFGTGCTSADGISRSGKITYLLSGPIVSPGTTCTVTLTNYVVNGYGIQGQYTITNNSNETVGVSINTQVVNGIITYPNTTNYHYSHNKTYIQTAGMSTVFDISDDVWSLSGTSSFASSEGNSIVFTASPNTPLVRAVTCHNISKGIVSFVYDQSVNGTIDFGDGTCDNLAALTIGSYHQNITLR
jgi:hypothetical protein